MEDGGWLNSSWGKKQQQSRSTTSFVILWKSIDCQCWVYRWEKPCSPAWITPQGGETIGTIWSYWCSAAIIKVYLRSPSLWTRYQIIHHSQLSVDVVSKKSQSPGCVIGGTSFLNPLFLHSYWNIMDASLNCVIFGVLFRHSSTL